jgi:AcrR family transcriptional regulator
MLVTNIHAVTTERSLRTRTRLQACALELFTAQGFDATTVEQIAAAAGVSHMTFFRHFPTKESVLVQDPYDPLMADAVRAQPRDLPALERVRRGIRSAWEGAPMPVDAETQARVAIMSGNERLRAKAWENTMETERVIVEALEETGVPRLEALVAAGACIGAVMAALFDWGLEGGDEPLGPRLLAALDLLAAPGADADPGTRPTPDPGHPTDPSTGDPS